MSDRSEHARAGTRGELAFYAVVRALRVRLGAPNHPGDILAFSGSVQSVDPATGAVVVALQGANGLGAHVTGTVEHDTPSASMSIESVFQVLETVKKRLRRDTE